MIISGIQKLSLLDYPGYVGCTLFTPGCNFRCPFCHNSSLVLGTAPNIELEEIFSFLDKRKGTIDAVTVSGGEPLLQNDLEAFIRNIKELGYRVKLDTNGSQPEKLKNIIETGLIDYVAMDLKNRPEKYSATIGGSVDIETIQRSVEIIKKAAPDFEFRTTIVKQFHVEGDIAALTSFFKPGKYFLQAFVDSGELLLGEALSACTREEMEAFKREAEPFCDYVGLRGIR